ncbi:short chain enoyl-CoA hydratase /3-hydroxyacyl-CoA dehydrogenase [Pacificibacter maritimus]|uniref:Short chain enoyl-CoA hydratase /3-hydroxyacyl-CoA dehydrogenase n=1 Tax=Pacificibacter maritimus TaxID=762213 RepID=A0A3N4V3Y5_9RHOB|nr:enoyl-CoA hydratase-related protein [Pacificibacter maritimus]RPE71817.1 short chain enoyl-CoA hydratase /3-hydroxyacyl-CoA dehydrogenase [Pacificibacter maritimus]
MTRSDATVPEEHDVKPLVTTRSAKNVAYITLANPPVNALTVDLRRSLLSSLQLAQDDPSVTVICLRGQGAGFSVGFDVKELATLPEGQLEAAPTLSDLCAAIETSPKPVVAALHGTVFEAGLALALAAHYRVCGPKARFAAPEVTFGMIPGGGVTQRLPRLTGPNVALELLLSGKSIFGQQAQQVGLVDHVVDMRTPKGVASFCAKIQQTDRPAPRSCDVTTGLADGAGFMAEINRRRAKVPRHHASPARLIIDCVEAAVLLPFEAGLFREEAARVEMLGAPHVKAMRYANYAERRAVRPVDFDPQPAQPIQSIGIAGTSNMAVGLAMIALDRGFSVVLFGSDANQVALAQSKVTRSYDQAAQMGQVSEAEKNERLGRFLGSDGLRSLSACDLVIEASTGSVERRAQILSRIEEFVDKEALLATIGDHGFTRIAQDLSHSDRFLGLHFFAPVQAVRLVELVRPENLSQRAFASAYAAMRTLGKAPITVPAQDGLIANTLQAAIWDAVDVMLLLGVSPSQIDTAMENYGFATGPCAQMDALGLAHLSGVAPTVLVAEGRLGRGGSGGFYSYSLSQSDAIRGDDSAAIAILDPIREGAGIDRVFMSDSEICDRIVLAQANAGAKALQTGAASRPIDIDAVMLMGKGYPRWHGGPMMAADIMTPLVVQKKLRQFSLEAPDIWEPVQLWAELIKNGDLLENLNDF